VNTLVPYDDRNLLTKTQPERSNGSPEKLIGRRKLDFSGYLKDCGVFYSIDKSN